MKQHSLIRVGVLGLVLAWPQVAPTAPPRATLYLPGGDVEQEITTAIEAKLTADKRVRFQPLSKLLSPQQSLSAAEMIANASRIIGESEKLLATLEMEAAEAKLGKLVTTLESQLPHLPFAKWKQLYLKAVMNYAFSLQLGERPDQAKLTLLRAFVIDPRLEYEKSRFPPQMKRPFDEARFLLDAMGSGQARISSRPSGATVWVNGKAVGVTPVTLKIPAVRNLITISKVGYRSKTAVLNVPVDGAAVAKLSLKLSRLPDLPVASFSQAAREAARGQAGPGLRAIARHLECDVVFAGALFSDEGSVSLQLRTYDARSERIISTGRATVTAASDEALGELLASLMAPLTQQTTVVRRTKPWWRRMVGWKYFWPTVGAIAGAAAVATTIGIVAANAPSDSSRARRVVLLPAVTPRW